MTVHSHFDLINANLNALPPAQDDLDIVNANLMALPSPKREDMSDDELYRPDSPTKPERSPVVQKQRRSPSPVLVKKEPAPPGHAGMHGISCAPSQQPPSQPQVGRSLC